MESFPLHERRAQWQNEQYRNLVQNLPLKTCLCVHDFSENYQCSEKTELQSTYFQKTEVSIHVTVINRHCILTHDGIESTEKIPP
jgi:membrane-bound inhibitor of C-type lysozyme